MKKTAFYIFLIVPFFFANVSHAQNSMFAGKIVDQNNRPVKGAIIKVSRPDMPPIEAVSDSDGWYRTREVALGDYYLDVFTDGKYRGENQLLIDTASGSRKIFVIKVHSRNFAVTSVEKDPEADVKLRTLPANDHVAALESDSGTGTYMFMLKKDTTSVKIIPVAQPVAEEKKPVKIKKRRR